MTKEYMRIYLIALLYYGDITSLLLPDCETPFDGEATGVVKSFGN